MENVLFQRIVIILLTVAATFAAFYGYAYLKYPANWIVIGISVAVVGGLLSFLSRKEKRARLDAFYRAAGDFGRPLSFADLSASFERDGTQFDCSFPRGEYETSFKANFYLPNLRHKFIIQHDSIGRKTLYGCGPTTSTEVSDDFFLSDDGTDFLPELLKNRTITDELYNYPKSMMSAFWIVFDEGSFEIAWTAPPSLQSDAFYQVCQTASVFHDELKKKSGVTSHKS